MNAPRDALFYEAHPLAALLPMISGTAEEASDLNDAQTDAPASEMQRLVDDIKKNGLLDLMVRLPDADAPGGYLLLDGRNRQEACRRARRGPFADDYRDYEPGADGDLFAFVWSKNLRRRHLSTSQRAMAAHRFTEWLRLQKEPPSDEAAPDDSSEDDDAPKVIIRRVGETKIPDEVAILPPGKKTRDVAAAAFSVSPRLVQDARTIGEKGTERLRAAVNEGRLTVGAAVKVARLPRDKQDEVVTAAAGASTERLKTKALAAGIRRIKNDLRLHEQIQEAGGAEAVAAAVDEVIDLRNCDVLELVNDDDRPGFDLVVVDFPWSYRNGGTNGSPDGHYDVTDNLRGFAGVLADVYERAPINCYALVWCTFPMLGDWFAAAAAVPRMGWRYLTGGAWVKPGAPGAGIHWRGNAEVLLIYKKGTPKPYSRQALRNFHSEAIGQHSEKPTSWYTQLLPHFCRAGGRVLDLYAGMAPVARACLETGHHYLGAELDPKRHQKALAALALAKREPERTAEQLDLTDLPLSPNDDDAAPTEDAPVAVEE